MPQPLHLPQVTGYTDEQKRTRKRPTHNAQGFIFFSHLKPHSLVRLSARIRAPGARPSKPPLVVLPLP